MATDGWSGVLLIKKDVLKQKESFLGDFERLLQILITMKLANTKYLFWGLERGFMASDGSGDGYRWLNLCPMDQKRCFEAKEIVFGWFWVTITGS